MRKLCTLILLVAALTVKAKDIPQVANILGRQTTSLNGPWHYIVDVQEEGYYDYRMKPIREAYNAHVLKIFKGKAQFLVSGLDGASAAVLGASAIGWEIQ